MGGDEQRIHYGDEKNTQLISEQCTLRKYQLVITNNSEQYVTKIRILE